MTDEFLGQQMELIPRAMINGQPMLQLPEDLYIPPEALEIFLETFEGPLDLLLYLIRKDNIDILDIPIASITRQYMEYIRLMKSLKLELAADYLVMAAMLAEIKSRLLVPKAPSVTDDGDEQDPRSELIRRLQIYEQMKKAAEDLSCLPQLERDIFWANAQHDRDLATPAPVQIQLDELIKAMQQILGRCALRQHHEIKFEAISVRERMSDILTQLQNNKSIEFTQCFNLAEGRVGLVASFIALLELLKEGHIKIVQQQPFATIFLALTEQ